MGQRYTDQQLAQDKARRERDDHAHARIDALQKALAGIIAGILSGDLEFAEGGPGESAANKTLAHFKEVDKAVEKRLGLQ